MKQQVYYYAVQVTTDKGDNLLCWRDKKHFYFSTETNGTILPPPALFNKKRDAKAALDEIPIGRGNLKQFKNVITAKKHKIVKVFVSTLKA